ncbi:MAG: SRPBCC family protein [Candidatus Dormibacteria bacterium]
MPEVHHRILIPVTPEEAWDFIADVRNAPHWMFGVKEVAGSLSPPLRPGDRLNIRLVAGGKLADSEWVIGACERPSLVSSRGHAMGASAQLRILCRPVGPSSTEVTQELSYQLPGGALGYLAARFGVSGILEVQAHRSLQALAQQLDRSGDRASRALPAEEIGGGGARSG